MIHAYDKESLDPAMDSLGSMLEYASLDVGFDTADFYQMFLVSGYADHFGTGETRIVNGMSGVELAREVIWKTRRENIEIPPVLHFEKGEEYWAGWAAAYYQWYCARPFRVISEAVPFPEVLEMYHPYHEMDLVQFSDAMDRRMEQYFQKSRLARLRKYAELTQKELAEASGVPIRTIQQYEQGQKDLGKAAGETLLRIAGALKCGVEDLVPATRILRGDGL